MSRDEAKRARPPSDREPWVVADDEGVRVTFSTEDAAWRYRDEFTDRLTNPTVTYEPAKFDKTYCSQCGKELGAGDAGVSHCSDHSGPSVFTAPTPWSAVANSWQHTTIYDAKQMPICRFDLEDWGVDEDNQEELEREQSAVAALIVRAVNSHSTMVDWLGLALELEAQAKRVESKSAMRAMYSAAHGLRLMGLHSHG